MNKLLIVDDSYAARIFVAKMLDECKFDIYFAENGIEALALIKTLQPHIMLIDLLMPKMGGIEVLELLKAQVDKPKVIVLSADIQSSTKQKCLQLGAEFFLQKPVEKEELIQTINDLLNIG